MRYLAVILIPLLLACGGGRPVNVILIVVDTLRADHLGCYGAPMGATPAIDSLAAAGTRFDAAITQAPFTLPSITSIVTSLYPYHHQVRNNQTNLDDRFTTMAEVFRDAGYRTGAVVGSAVLEKGRNLTQGFSFYDDTFPDHLEVYSEELRRAGVSLGDRAQRRASDVTGVAWNWIREGGSGPFFLMVHYFDPHSKYDPPPPFSDRFSKRAYVGEVAYTDYEIGRLLAGLRAKGLDRNTLIALVADHGESLGQHGEAEHGFFVYEPTIHVPMIISAPGIVPAGKVESALVRSIDLFPTILSLVGLEPPDGIDGADVSPLFRGEAIEGTPVYTEAFLGYFGYGWSPTRSIRTKEWKFIEAPRKELYHLLDDPNEAKNLYGVERREGRRLEAILKEHLERERNAVPVEMNTGDIGEEQRKRLEALGYVNRSNKAPADPFADLPDAKDEVKKFNERQAAVHRAVGARKLIQSGEIRKGIAVLQEVYARYPDQRGLREFLGMALLAAEDYAGAEAIYRELIKAFPGVVENYSGLGVALSNQGRLAEGVALFEECARLVPDDPRYAEIVSGEKEAIEKGRPFHIDYHPNFGPGR